MHRRRSLGFCMLLLLVFLAGSAWATPEPRATSEVSSVGTSIGSFDLLELAWDWLASLVTGGESSSGGEHLNHGDGGVFIDPLGNS